MTIISCLECDCNRQAKTCHNRTGRCYCTTKGIIGDKCDKCDRGNQYYGDPVKDSCFCKLILVAMGPSATFQKIVLLLELQNNDDNFFH